MKGIERKIAVMIVGIAGIGKGFLGRCLAGNMAAFGMTSIVVNTGDYCRAHPDLCRVADKGALAADHHIFEHIKHTILLHHRPGFLLIDSPRGHDQIVGLTHLLMEEGYEVRGGIYIDGTPDTAKSRIAARKENGGVQRNDDLKPRVINKRMKTFINERASILQEIQAYTHPCVIVDGSQGKLHYMEVAEGFAKSLLELAQPSRAKHRRAHRGH